MSTDAITAKIRTATFVTALSNRPRLTRRIVQIGFFKLNVLIGILFYHWVRYFETGGTITFRPRPAGVEGWLPIASLMGVRYTIETTHIPDVHPAGIFLMLAFLSVSLLFHKAFCSWLCPIGTLSELLAKIGNGVFRSYLLPRWIDLPLRGLKYVLLGTFLFVICAMSIGEIEVFLAGDYGLIADVRLLNFFRFMSAWTAITLSALVVLSVLITNFWCRYLCPYGALMGLLALASPTRIERSTERCTGCERCSKACPSNLPVSSLVKIRSAECTMCFECVAACPTRDSLQATVGDPLLDGIKRRSVSGVVMATGILVVLFGAIGIAKSTNHWNTSLPDDVYRELIPKVHKAVLSSD